MVEARFHYSGRCVTGSRPVEPNPQLAPNFSLRELARLDGAHFIHPNLILTLQNIRTYFQTPENSKEQHARLQN